MSEILIHYISKKKYFTMAFFNERIDSFPFAMYEKGDLPQHLYKSKSCSWENFRVQQNALEMGNLIRLFPLLIGSEIPDDDDKWDIALSFVELCLFLLSPVFSSGRTFHLVSAIDDFMTSLYEAFPHVSVKPKGHYLTHYPHQILTCGPPVDHGTIRFEGKHHYFVSVYNRSNNRINVTKSLATHHQYMMYLHYKKEFILSYDNINTVFSKTVTVDDLSDEVSALVRTVTRMPRITIFDGVTYEGIHYRTGNALVIRFDEEDLLFGQVELMFVYHDLLYVVYTLLETIFGPHLNAYEITGLYSKGISSTSALADSFPLGVYDVDNSSFFTIRHEIMKSVH